jgi:hypothetical protein
MTHFVGAMSHLYSSTRALRTDPWSTPVPIASLAVPETDTNPWLSPDGLRITFVSSRSEPAFHLNDTTRAARTDSWSPPVRLGVDVAGFENDPTESADGLELFFTAPSAEVGGYDVYRATRASVDDAFGTPELVRELSSMGDEVGVRLSRDGRKMYLAYNALRSGGQNAAISTATRVCN